MKRQRTKDEITARFLARVNVNENGCWEWQGYRDKSGYGQVMIRQLAPRLLSTHRLAAYLWLGMDDLKASHCVCHHCDNRICVNPQHLYLGNRITNNQDRDRRGRCKAGENEKAITHCPFGHSYSAENTYLEKGRKRHCKICRRRRVMESYWRTGREKRLGHR